VLEPRESEVNSRHKQHLSEHQQLINQHTYA